MKQIINVSLKNETKRIFHRIALFHLFVDYISPQSQKMKQNAYMDNSEKWNKSSILLFSRKWNKTYLHPAILKSFTLPPYCFLENETKRFHYQTHRIQVSLPPFWKIKQNILDLTLLKNETNHTSLWHSYIHSCLPLLKGYIFLPLNYI